MGGGVRHDPTAQLCVFLVETLTLSEKPPGSDRGLVCHWYISTPDGASQDHVECVPFLPTEPGEPAKLNWCAFLIIDADAEADLRMTIADSAGNHIGVHFGSVRSLASSEQFGVKSLSLDNVKGELARAEVHAAAQIRWTPRTMNPRERGAVEFVAPDEDAQAEHIWGFLFQDLPPANKQGVVRSQSQRHAEEVAVLNTILEESEDTSRFSASPTSPNGEDSCEATHATFNKHDDDTRSDGSMRPNKDESMESMEKEKAESTARKEKEEADARQADLERAVAAAETAARNEKEAEAQRLALERDRAEQQRLTLERERAERHKAERLAAEKKDAEREEAEQREAARLAAERREAEQQTRDAERREAERRVAEQLEAERLQVQRAKEKLQEAEAAAEAVAKQQGKMTETEERRPSVGKRRKSSARRQSVQGSGEFPKGGDETPLRPRRSARLSQDATALTPAAVTKKTSGPRRPSSLPMSQRRASLAQQQPDKQLVSKRGSDGANTGRRRSSSVSKAAGSVASRRAGNSSSRASSLDPPCPFWDDPQTQVVSPPKAKPRPAKPRPRSEDESSREDLEFSPRSGVDDDEGLKIHARIASSRPEQQQRQGSNGHEPQSHSVGRHTHAPVDARGPSRQSPAEAREATVRAVSQDAPLGRRSVPMEGPTRALPGARARIPPPVHPMESDSATPAASSGSRIRPGSRDEVAQGAVASPIIPTSSVSVSAAASGAAAELVPRVVPSGRRRLYRVTTKALAVRVGADWGAARTGTVLRRGDIFEASVVAPGVDGRIYLKLAGWRGWVFDDSAVDPADPSVELLPEEEVNQLVSQGMPPNRAQRHTTNAWTDASASTAVGGAALGSPRAVAGGAWGAPPMSRAGALPAQGSVDNGVAPRNEPHCRSGPAAPHASGASPCPRWAPCNQNRPTLNEAFREPPCTVGENRYLQSSTLPCRASPEAVISPGASGLSNWSQNMHVMREARPVSTEAFREPLRPIGNSGSMRASEAHTGVRPVAPQMLGGVAVSVASAFPHGKPENQPALTDAFMEAMGRSSSHGAVARRRM